MAPALKPQMCPSARAGASNSIASAANKAPPPNAMKKARACGAGRHTCATSAPRGSEAAASAPSSGAAMKGLSNIGAARFCQSPRVAGSTLIGRSIDSADRTMLPSAPTRTGTTTRPRSRVRVQPTVTSLEAVCAPRSAIYRQAACLIGSPQRRYAKARQSRREGTRNPTPGCTPVPQSAPSRRSPSPPQARPAPLSNARRATAS